MLGPQTPTVLEDVQRIEDSAAKLRARWGADAPKVCARRAGRAAAAGRGRRRRADRRGGAARDGRQAGAPRGGGMPRGGAPLDPRANQFAAAMDMRDARARREAEAEAQRRRAPAANAALTRLQAQATATARRDWGAARSAGGSRRRGGDRGGARLGQPRGGGPQSRASRAGYAQQYAKLLNTLATPRAPAPTS